ncbi:MAG: lipopolysaccharide biosynthesis protein [Rhodomicrobium sp.]
MKTSDYLVTFGLPGLAVLVQTFSPAIIAIYRAQERYSRGLFVDVFATAARVMAALAFLLLGGGPIGVAAIQLLILVAVSLLIVPLDLKRLDNRLRFLASRRTGGEIAEIFRTAPQFYVQHLANIVLLNVPVLALAGLADSPGLVAVFVLTRTLINIARQLIGVIANGVAVELARFHAMGEKRTSLEKKLVHANHFVTVLCAAGLGTLFVVMKPLMHVWSGEKLHADPNLTIILGLSLLLFAPFATIINFLTYIGEARILATSKVATVAASLAVGVALRDIYGVYGVAWALVLEATISGGICLTVTARWANTSPAEAEFKFLTYIVGGILPVLIIGNLLSTSSQTSLASLIMGILFTLPTAMVCVLVFGMSQSSRSWLFGRIRSTLQVTRVSN